MAAAPNGVAKLQAQIAEAYFPFEITNVVEPSHTIMCGIETKSFGPLRFSRMSSNARYRGRRQKDARSNDFFVLHFMEEGSVIFTQRRRSIQALTGALVLINPDPLLLTEKLTATEAVAILIPSQLLTMHFPEAKDWDLSVRGSSAGTAAVLREVMACAWRQRDSISASEAFHVSKAMIQLIGATFGKDDSQLSLFSSHAMRMHYGRICSFVIQNLENENLSADFISEQLRISKSYLYAIFKEANTTLGRLVLELRLERCREMLSDSSMNHVSISEIAFSMGFHELPHFSRCFSKRYGESPRAFRAGVRQPSGLV